MLCYLIKILPDTGEEHVRIQSIETDVHIENIDFVSDESDFIHVDADFHKSRYGFALSNSEIQNFKTHRKVWKRFLETSESCCFIIENNVLLDTALSVVMASMQEIPDDWDLFFPYNQSHNTSNNPAALLINPNPREMINWQPYLLGYQWGNSIYSINRKGAEKLLEIDTIRQRLDDEMLLLSNTEKLTVYTGEVDWFDYNRQVKLIDFKDRTQLIWNAIRDGGSWTALRKERVRNLLKTMSDVAEELKIDLILQGGTHLGYVRHGGIMIWDDDVDIGIEEYQLQKYLDGLKTVDGICFGEVIEPGTKVPYYKVWHNDGEAIENYHYTFPFVDLWIFNRIENDLVFKNGIICPGSANQDFEEILFEGAKLKIPYNSIEILDTRYTDWRTKIRVYPWSHCCESAEFFPLTLDIEVDDKGRMVSQFY